MTAARITEITIPDPAVDLLAEDPPTWEWPPRGHGTVCLIRPPGHLAGRGFWRLLAAGDPNDINPDPVAMVSALVCAHPELRDLDAAATVRLLAACRPVGYTPDGDPTYAHERRRR